MSRVKAAERISALGGAFGRAGPQTVKNAPGQARKKATLGYFGLVSAFPAGYGGHAVKHRKERKGLIKEQRANSGKQASNTRKIRGELERQAFGKAEVVHRITDVGTRAEKHGYDAYSTHRPRRFRMFSPSTKAVGATAVAGGLALGVANGRADIKGMKRRTSQQRSRLKRQEEKMQRLGIAKSAFDVEHSVTKSVINPNSVPQGKRKRNTKKGKYKDRPKVGRGNYVKAPLMRDKVTKPRWVANAVVNNPGSAAAVGALGGAAAIQAAKKKLPEKHKKKADAATGALVGGAAGHGARLGADYGTKALAERQFAPLTTKGNYGPYTEGPHKPVLNKYKRTAKGDVRAKAKMFDENFPKGIPSYHARKAGVLLNKKPAVIGTVAAGAAIGAVAGGHKKKVKKSMSLSAFGVDHTEEITKKKEQKYSEGRAVAATLLGPTHSAVAGKKGKKLRATGRSLGYGIGGGAAGTVAGTALAGPSLGTPAGLAAGYYGNYRAFRRNNKKGYYKKQPKEELQ